LIGGRNIGTETEVGLLELHKAEEVGGEGVCRILSSFWVRGFRDIMGMFGSHGFATLWICDLVVVVKVFLWRGRDL
jgi:hypothetical protein